MLFVCKILRTVTTNVILLNRDERNTLLQEQSLTVASFMFKTYGFLA